MKVAIVGTGYVGLTTGVVLAYLGHHVTCVDVNPAKLASLKAGKAPIYEPGLEELLALAAERLAFTYSYAEAVPQADVVFIAVGTPPLPDGNPDLQYLQAAAAGIRGTSGRALHRGGQQIHRAHRQRELGGSVGARSLRGAQRPRARRVLCGGFQSGVPARGVGLGLTQEHSAGLPRGRTDQVGNLSGLGDGG